MNIVATKLRTLISQDRIRHEELSLNIDLTYITNRILAMSFPASGIEAAWRNDIDDVCRLLRVKHKNNFLVWNLSEREYEYDLLDNQIVCVPFKDHHAPPLHIIFQIIMHIDAWLRANPQHVGVVHCMGGKGRTGLVIVCYLFYSGLFTDITKCLTYFALRRSATGKGVTQPSQLRYVKYFSDVVSGKKGIPIRALTLQKVIVGPIPKGVYVFVEIYQQSFDEGSSSKVPAEKFIYSTFSANSEARNLDPRGHLVNHSEVRLSGDILLRGYYLLGGKSKPRPLFRMQFYVGLLESNDIVVPREHLDDMHKEKKRFSSDFHLRLIFDPNPPVEDAPASIDDEIFAVMRASYKDMLSTRVKGQDAELEIAPARAVTWQNGSYANGLLQVHSGVKMNEHPTNFLNTSSNTQMRQRYRESMLQIKTSPAQSQQQPLQDSADDAQFLDQSTDQLLCNSQEQTESEMLCTEQSYPDDSESEESDSESEQLDSELLEPDQPDDQPECDKPEFDTPVSDKPESDKLMSDTPEPDKLVSDTPESDKPESDKPSGKPESDTPESDKPESDKPESDKPESDKPEFDKPESDKPEFDKPEPDQQVPDPLNSTQSQPKTEPQPQVQPEQNAGEVPEQQEFTSEPQAEQPLEPVQSQPPAPQLLVFTEEDHRVMRRRYLHKHLDYLEAQLSQLEALAMLKYGPNNNNTEDNKTPTLDATTVTTTTTTTATTEDTTPISSSPVDATTTPANPNSTSAPIAIPASATPVPVTATSPIISATSNIRNRLSTSFSNLFKSDSNLLTKSRSNTSPKQPLLVAPLQSSVSSPNLPRTPLPIHVVETEDKDTDSIDSGNNTSDDTASFDNANSDTASDYGSDNYNTPVLSRKKRGQDTPASVLSPPNTPPLNASPAPSSLNSTPPEVTPSQPTKEVPSQPVTVPEQSIDNTPEAPVQPQPQPQPDSLDQQPTPTNPPDNDPTTNSFSTNSDGTENDDNLTFLSEQPSVQ